MAGRPWRGADAGGAGGLATALDVPDGGWRRLRGRFRALASPGRIARARTLLVALAGAALFVQLFASATFAVDAFRLRLSLNLFDGGLTTVQLPPLGRIEAHTHRGFVGVELTLTDINPDLLRRMIAQSTRAEAVARAERELEHAVVLFVAWTLALAAGGSVFLLYLLGERNRRHLAAGAAAGVAAIGALVLLTWGSYRPQAFRQPRFVGALRAAPEVVGLVDQSFRHARVFQRQLGAIAANLYRLFGAIDRLPPLGGEQSRADILVVSDIHDNPLALDLIARTIASFRPRFVLDAGDLTDWGTTLEAQILQRIASLGLPYLIAPGNHDSPAELAALGRLPKVVLLDGREVVQAGVPIVGLADPSSATPSPAVAPADVLDAAGQRLAAAVRAAPLPPTVVIAHNPTVMLHVVGLAPILISGHTHTIWVRTVAGGVWLNPGTTGAAGVRGLTTSTPPPYSLMLLYLGRAGGRTYLRAVDTVRLAEVSGTLDLQRQVFPPPPPRPLSDSGFGRRALRST